MGGMFPPPIAYLLRKMAKNKGLTDDKLRKHFGAAKKNPSLPYFQGQQVINRQAKDWPKTGFRPALTTQTQAPRIQPPSEEQRQHLGVPRTETMQPKPSGAARRLLMKIAPPGMVPMAQAKGILHEHKPESDPGTTKTA